MVSVDVSLDRAKLKIIYERQKKLIRRNIISVLKKQALPHLVDLIMIGYDALSERADMGPEDPTNPSLWRDEFKAKLEQELANTSISGEDTIYIKLGNKEFLGYTDGERIDPDDNQPLHWLVYYIEGLAGDWAFISPEDYEILTGQTYKPEWGRFSQGFMISAEEYSDKGWDQKIPFFMLRHPFSGYSPLDIFKVALDEFTLRPFIERAVTAASKGQRL